MWNETKRYTLRGGEFEQEDRRQPIPSGYRTYVLYPEDPSGDTAFTAIAVDVMKELCANLPVLTVLKRWAYHVPFSLRRAFNTIPSVEIFKLYELEKTVFADDGMLCTVTEGYNAPLTRLITDPESMVYQGNWYTAYVVDGAMPTNPRTAEALIKNGGYRMSVEYHEWYDYVQFALREDEFFALADTVRRVCVSHGRVLQQK